MKRKNRKLCEALHEAVVLISDQFLCDDPSGRKYPELWAFHTHAWLALDRFPEWRTSSRFAEPSAAKSARELGERLAARYPHERTL